MISFANRDKLLHLHKFEVANKIQSLVADTVRRIRMEHARTHLAHHALHYNNKYLIPISHSIVCNFVGKTFAHDA